MRAVHLLLVFLAGVIVGLIPALVSLPAHREDPALVPSGTSSSGASEQRDSALRENASLKHRIQVLEGDLELVRSGGGVQPEVSKPNQAGIRTLLDKMRKGDGEITSCDSASVLKEFGCSSNEAVAAISQYLEKGENIRLGERWAFVDGAAVSCPDSRTFFLSLLDKIKSKEAIGILARELVKAGSLAEIRIIQKLLADDRTDPCVETALAESSRKALRTINAMDPETARQFQIDESLKIVREFNMKDALPEVTAFIETHPKSRDKEIAVGALLAMNVDRNLADFSSLLARKALEPAEIVPISQEVPVASTVVLVADLIRSGSIGQESAGAALTQLATKVDDFLRRHAQDQGNELDRIEEAMGGLLTGTGDIRAENGRPFREFMGPAYERIEVLVQRARDLRQGR